MPVTVSIIIAAYNAADCIGAAIASCLAQTETRFEVIIVDDASPESLETAVQAAAKGDPRVRFYRLSQNSGPSGARNKGLREARGDYIAILDADDTMQPARLAKMLAAAELGQADITVDNMIAHYVGSDDPDAPFLDPDKLSEAETITLATYVDPLTSDHYGRPLGYLKPLFRRQTINDAALKYDTALTNSEDFYFVAELLALGSKMRLIPSADYVYTIQAGSISHRLNPKQTAAIVAAETAFQDRYKETFDTPTRVAAARRLAKIKQAHQFETLIEDLRRKSPAKFIQHLFASGTNMPRHIFRLVSIAARRLT